MAEQKISPYNLADLKNSTDDALSNYLRSISFKQDHSKTDTKLAIGYASVLIAAALFAADYKLGWDATKHWTAAAVVAYGLLNALFTYWVWYVERGTVFEGTKDKTKISLLSKTNKHEPTYYLTVSYVTDSSPIVQSKQIQAPFTTWFTADGYFVAKPFQQWLASSIEVVGDADEKNASRDERDLLAAPGDAATHVSGTDSAGTGTKRAKRKGGRLS